MLQLKANNQIKTVFQRLIRIMGVGVEWSGNFIVINNNLILAGRLRSMIFNFDNKKVTTNVMEININESALIPVEDNSLLTDVLNMTLYIFGKWGAITGLKVEKDYAQLNKLFQHILKGVGIEPSFQDSTIRFYMKDVRITYEDAIQEVLDWTKRQAEEEEEIQEEYKLGLWHSMEWKKHRRDFQWKKPGVREEADLRLGHNFYPVSFLCPECGRNIAMVLFETDEEVLIDTQEGGVYIARAYTCSRCHLFHTAAPGRLIREGDVYELDFQEDKEAYDDYLELLGDKGGGRANFKLNEYEWQRKKRKARIQESLEKIALLMEDMPEDELLQLRDKMEEGLFPRSEAMKYYDKVENHIRERQWEREREIRGSGQEQASSSRKKAESHQKKEKRHPGTWLKRISKLKRSHIFQKGDPAISHFSPETCSSLQNRQKEESSGGFMSRGQGRIPDPKHRGHELEIRSGARGGRADDELRDRESKIQAGKIQEEKTQESGKMQDERIPGDRCKTPEMQNRQDDYEIQDSHNLAQDRSAQREYRKAGLGMMPDENLHQEQENQPGRSRQTGLQDGEEKDVPADRTSGPADDKPAVTVNKQEKQERSGMNALNTDSDEPGKEALGKEKTAAQDHRETLDQEEQAEISRLVDQADSNDRNSLYDLYQLLKSRKFSPRNIDTVLEELYEAILQMDQDELDRICPDPEKMDFGEAFRAFQRIQEGMYLPELKGSMLKVLDKRLRAIKLDENSRLVEKLHRELDHVMDNFSRIYFCNMKEWSTSEQESKEEKAISKALNTYSGSRGMYEYPVIVCDSSYFANGKEGFLLTPDYLYYKGILGHGRIPVDEIEDIIQKNSFGERGLFINRDGRKKLKLPNGVHKSQWESFAEAITAFVGYLQEKPESRSIAYLADENHKVKCCYRCGYTYQGGNICPNCGSKTNK